MATSQQTISTVTGRKSDPLIRGFEQQNQNEASNPKSKLQPFGHRTDYETPHAFETNNLLQKLATDPEIVFVLIERELIVGTLAELDPIDDRLAAKKSTKSQFLFIGLQHQSRITHRFEIATG